MIKSGALRSLKSIVFLFIIGLQTNLTDDFKPDDDFRFLMIGF
jgi:hypothetical protein